MGSGSFEAKGAAPAAAHASLPTLALASCALLFLVLDLAHTSQGSAAGGVRASRPAAVLARAPPPSGALPAPSVCSSEQVQAQVRLLDKGQSKCPGHAWWPHFVAAGMACRAVTVVNVGANKGYSLASFADLFAPELGLTPAAIYPRILARFGDAEHGGSVNHPCGACDDCRVDHLHSASTRTCVLPSGQEVPATHFSTDIHGFEPIAANVDIIRAGVMAVAEAASVPNTRIHLHRVAVVGDAALQEVPFGMCPPGLERCGVEAAGTAGKVATWNHDQVRIENVPASTVDAMAEKFGVAADIDVLAVDTEGLDPEVIDGAAGMLRAHRIQVLEFEYHAMRAWKTRSLEGVVKTLDGYGYDCFLAQHYVLLQLTGCWDAAYEFKDWSNVICVPRSNTALLAVAQMYVPIWAR